MPRSTIGQAVLLAMTLAAGFPTALFGQRGLYHTAEPPMADGSIQQASAQVPAYAQPSSAPAAPVVTIQIIAPAFVTVGKDVEYKLVVGNSGNFPAADVQVNLPLPKGATLKKAEPQPAGDPGSPTWSLGTLAAGARKEISIVVLPAADAPDCIHTAKVRFEQSKQVTTKIAKPELSVKVVAPTQLQQFDIVPMRLEVLNPGMIETKDIQVSLPLPDALTHTYDPPLPGQQPAANDPKSRSWTIPRLGPNEIRFLEFRVTPQKVGPAPLLAHATVGGGSKVEGKLDTQVIAPKLELSVNGPPQRAAHQSAAYRITVRNAGAHAMRNVTVSDHAPPGCEILTASDGGQIFDQDVQWILPLLQPGESRILELTTRCSSGGKVVHQFAAVYRGFRQAAEATTDFSALAALRLTLQGAPQAVEVNGSVRYVITVENAGSAAATNVRPVVTIPDALSFALADPPTHRRDGNRVLFDPVSLPAGGRQTYSVTLKATRADLTATVTTDLLADQLESGPIRKQEATAITAGRPAP